jgi:uncharacterized protein (TIGR00252 family)
MEEIAALFPEYGFEKHVGYGTAFHLAAIREYQPSPIHRITFAPMSMKPPQVVNTAVLRSGALAEIKARKYLHDDGYEIIASNWKTKWCEVDIVARKDKIIYFVEVKYRKNPDQGDGLDYITAQKQKQMKFAAELWASKAKWNGDIHLAALEVSGGSFAVTNWLSNIA